MVTMNVRVRSLVMFAVLVCAGQVASAQYVAVSGNCELPGQVAIISGLAQSGTRPFSGTPTTLGSGVMASYPQCVVTVYPANSGIPVPTGNIYSDTSGTVLGNPFTANADGSWEFFATQACYDVVLSSGIGAASQMPVSKTLAGKCAGVGTGGGSGVVVTTVAGLAAVPGATNGTIAVVTDSTSVSGCTVGGGSNVVNCQYNGTTWSQAVTAANGAMSLTPSTSQNVVQPLSAGVSTQLSANNLANIRYVTATWNWQQSPSDNLATPGSNTIHLTPCPAGIDTAASSHHYTYAVYISNGTGTAEAAPVTGGTCTPGLGTGTIIVTTVNAHTGAYTAGSSTSGIQEAWNDAWVNDSGTAPNANSQTAPYVKLMADTSYNIYSAIYLRGRGGILDGAGSLLVCSTRDRCIYIGTTQSTPYVNHHKLYNLSGTSTVNVDGVQVSSVAAASGTYTVTTASTHPFLVGDTVDCEYYSQSSSQHWASKVLTTGSNTFTVAFGSTSFSAGATTFGFCNLLNTFIEDNSDHVVIQDVNAFQATPIGLGYFTYAITNDNDQQLQIERASNRASCVIRANSCSGGSADTSSAMGAFIYERNDQGNDGITYVHDSEFTNVNCITAAGNGLVIMDNVCQAYPVYGTRYFGGLQPETLQDTYEEAEVVGANPLYGITASMGHLIGGAYGSKITGTWPIGAFTPVFATGGGTGAERSYFVVPRSSTRGYGPVLFIGSAEPLNSGVSIPLQWPSIELITANGLSVGTLTWDILVTTGTSAVAPNGTGTYSIALSDSGSCTTSGMCSFTDTQAGASSYTVQTQQFEPIFWFWPTGLAINNVVVLTDQLPQNTLFSASQGMLGVSIVSAQCPSPGGGYPSYRNNPIWIHCGETATNGGAGTIATVLQQKDYANNGPPANSKGRVNFGPGITAPSDLITLKDSNAGKTLATSGERPSNDAGDLRIGIDQTDGLAFGAKTSISEYINLVPDNSSYLERLTATAKTFKVPVQFASYVFASLPGSPVNGWEVYCSDCKNVTDDTTGTFDSAAASGGHGTTVLYENGAWRVH